MLDSVDISCVNSVKFQSDKWEINFKASNDLKYFKYNNVATIQCLMDIKDGTAHYTSVSQPWEKLCYSEPPEAQLTLNISQLVF